MGWIQIKDIKTGRILCDTRANLTTLAEKGPVYDEKGHLSYNGPTVDEYESFTDNDPSILSNWLSSEEAKEYGFKRKH